jgi:hypothetical protein
LDAVPPQREQPQGSVGEARDRGWWPHTGSRYGTSVGARMRRAGAAKSSCLAAVCTHRTASRMEHLRKGGESRKVLPSRDSRHGSGHLRSDGVARSRESRHKDRHITSLHGSHLLFVFVVRGHCEKLIRPAVRDSPRGRWRWWRRRCWRPRGQCYRTFDPGSIHHVPSRFTR